LLIMAHSMYRLFKGVDKQYASLLVAFVAVSVPISFLNVLNEIAALNLLNGAGFLSVFQTSQLGAMAMLFLGLHSAGIAAANIFWGLWLFPFGVLVIRSGFIPRILGVFLIIACFAYLATSFVYFLVPFYNPIVSELTVVPQALGEGSIIAWLLVKGAKPQSLNAPASKLNLGQGDAQRRETS
jgi:hypothetical protein